LGLNYIQLGDPEVNPGTPDAGEDPWGLTLSFNVPIWFDKYDSARAEALANKRVLAKASQARLDSLAAELHTGLNLLQDANRRMELYGEELLDLAEQAAENSRASYESGLTGILEVIDSERSLLDMKLLSWRAAADAWQQRFIIHTLANQPIPGIDVEEQHDE
jgi:outer membrane protein TolC